jgi:hypothetical protein
MTLTDIEEFLAKFPNLRHFELQIKGNAYDLCNGERWSTIARHLITFDFYFKSEVVVTTCPQLLIDTFCSPFWFEEKRWFVAYNSHPSDIFTVPRFASTSAYYSQRSSFYAPIYTTLSSDQSLFYDRINELKIKNNLNISNASHRFLHVKILSITNLKLLDRLEMIIDLTQIQCLKLTDI